MKKVWWLLLLVVMPTVSAYTLSDWPFMFVEAGKFKAKYVLAEEASSLDVVSATVISTSLAKFENVTTEVGTSTLDSEVSNISKINAIVIGSPCENKAAAQLMGNPEPCYKSLGGGLGYIRLYESGGKVQLLITGLEDKDRNAAAKYIANKTLTNIKTTEYLVPSGSGSVPPFYINKLNVSSNKTEIVNVTSNITIKNVTTPPINVTKNITEKKPVGKYEPLREMPKPKKKGFWASIWAWIAGLFT